MATQKQIKVLADDAEKIRAKTNCSLGDAIWAALDQHNITLTLQLRRDYYRSVRKECERRKSPFATPRQIKAIANEAVKIRKKQVCGLDSAIRMAIAGYDLAQDPEQANGIFAAVRKEFDLRNLSKANAKERELKNRVYFEQRQPRLF